MQIANLFKNILNKITALNSLITTITTNGVRLEQRTLLWTNPNPRNSFNAQTIQLNLSGYDEIGVNVCATSQNVDDIGPITSIETGKTGIATSISYPNASNFVWTGARQFTWNSSGVTFTNGQYMGKQSEGWATTWGIPYKIYGIKYISLEG